MHPVPLPEGAEIDSLHLPSSLYAKAPDKVYKLIYSRILDGSFAPGTKLTLRKVAQSCGVSVIPVIEALNRLVDDGLVESRPKWGFFVAMPNQFQAMNQLVLREAVECHVARLLNENLKAPDRKRLVAFAKRLDRDTTEFIRNQKGSEADIDKMHYDFHMLMAAWTGYDSLTTTLRRINLFFILLKADSTCKQTSIPDDWHTQLAEKIVAGPVDQAEAAMRIHVRHSRELILQNVSEAA